MEKNLEYFITKASLYEKIDLKEYINLFNEITPSEKPAFQVDMFCPKCQKETPFHLATIDSLLGERPQFITGSGAIAVLNSIKEKIDNRLTKADGYTIVLRCGRDARHLHVYKYKFVDEYLIKIGQYPSMADLENHTAVKYKKLLGKDYSNLNRAIGLNSHGIGAGAYVYLRRIFENLIEEKRQESLVSDSSWDDGLYSKSRMADKIEILKDKLPSIFKEAPHIYGILSKGVHELSEQQCLDYFPILRHAIESILDEKLERLEKQTRRENLLKSLHSIASEIK